MTQEEKSLLLQDLCARLPYGIVVNAQYKDGEGWKIEDKSLKGIYSNEQVYLNCVYTTIDNIKPYLRPMTSMTEEEHDEYIMIEYNINAGMTSKRDFTKWIDFVHSHYLDYRGLIEKGLALEAPKEMYKTE